MTPNPFTRATGQPRDPSRIDIVLSALRAYWIANPDLRLGQIVANAARERDPFGVEDEVLMAAWPEQKPTKAPRTCWTCRWAKGKACLRILETHPCAWDIQDWGDRNVDDDTQMPLPDAHPCPGFTEKT